MEEKLPYRNLSRREEKRLIESAANSVKLDFPNPERLDCPGPDVLMAIAQRRLSSLETEDIIDHIATCSPCFLEYTEGRRRHHLHVITGVALACAAAIVAVVVVWRFGPVHLFPRKEPLARELPSPVLKATLDFRYTTVERSKGAPPSNNQEIPHLRSTLVDLIIKLPIGTEDGVYSLQLRNRLDQPIVDTTGTATWDGSAETLITTVDLRKLEPGEYILALRHGSSSWRAYPVVVDAKGKN